MFPRHVEFGGITNVSLLVVVIVLLDAREHVLVVVHLLVAPPSSSNVIYFHASLVELVELVTIRHVVLAIWLLIHGLDNLVKVLLTSLWPKPLPSCWQLVLQLDQLYLLELLLHMGSQQEIRSCLGET